MILCDREIQALLDDGQLVIDPRPPSDSKQWSSTSVDLTLHGVVLEWAPQPPLAGGTIPTIRPQTANFNVQGMMESAAHARRIAIDPNLGYELRPGRFVLGYTRERVRFPTRCRVAARVEGKSSLARLGLGIHVTAPTIHAGFGAGQKEDMGSPIQLEIFNVGPWAICLDEGMRICQLILEEVREVPTAGYAGQFGAQRAFTVRPEG